VEKLLGHPKTGSIDPPKNLATPDLCSVRLLTCVSATDRGMIDKVNAVVERTMFK
jgi:hypothetical protein